MTPTGTEEDYLRLKQELDNIIAKDIAPSDKIDNLHHLNWEIREKFDTYFGDRTELTDRSIELYRKVGEAIQDLQKKNKL